MKGECLLVNDFSQQMAFCRDFEIFVSGILKESKI
jgi:hypothetical protein